MRIFDETNILIIEHEYEAAYLRNKLTNKIIFEDDFYGDPECGLIDINNEWAIIAGHHLSIWTHKRSRKIIAENFEWIHDIRLKNKKIVEVLTDPWDDYSAIWELNVETFQVKKVKDFNKYKGEPHTEDVIW